MTMPIPTNRATRQTGTYQDVQAVTPDNSTDLEYPCDALYATGAGNIVCITPAGTTVTIPVSANRIFLFRATRIKATGTTATGIFALYL